MNLDLDFEASKLWFLVLFEFVIIGIAVFLTLHYFASWRRTPFYAYGGVFFGWFFCMGIAFLLPTDIAGASYRQCVGLSNHTNATVYAPLPVFSSSTSQVSSSDPQISSSFHPISSSHHHQQPPIYPSSSVSYSNYSNATCAMPVIYIPDNIVTLCWEALYWSAFLLCWVVYPLMQNYSTAGDFTILEKFRTTLRENAWFYGAGAAVLIIFLFIFLFAAPTSNKNPIPVAMALSNAWGLILLIALLAYGLVEIPRGIWRSADLEMELKRSRFEVVAARARLVSAREDLTKTLRQVKSYEEKLERSDPFWPYVQEILRKVPPEEYRLIDRSEGSAELRYDKLVSLHYNLMSHEHNLRMYSDQYTRIVRNAFEVEDILRSVHGSDHTVRWTLRKHREWHIVSWLEWAWYCIIKPKFLRFLAFFFTLMSLCVIWCECFFFFDKPVLSLLALLIKPQAVRTSDIYLSLVLFGPLVYIMVCSYWSLFQLRIFSYYRLVGHQHSDSNSLLFSAAYLCRLAPPLSLNFIHMLKFSGSSFQTVMASMERMPFFGGYSFNTYAPIALVILCVGSFFNIATKFFKCIHIKRFTYDDTIDERQLDEGRGILEKERNLWISGTRLPGNDDFSAEDPEIRVTSSTSALPTTSKSASTISSTTSKRIQPTISPAPTGAPFSSTSIMSTFKNWFRPHPTPLSDTEGVSLNRTSLDTSSSTTRAHSTTRLPSSSTRVASNTSTTRTSSVPNYNHYKSRPSPPTELK